jgi:hypothetical protein
MVFTIAGLEVKRPQGKKCRCTLGYKRLLYHSYLEMMTSVLHHKEVNSAKNRNRLGSVFSSVSRLELSEANI